MDSKVVSRILSGLVLRGVLPIVFGVVALFYTGQTLLVLVYVFGVFALLSGITTIVVAVRAGEAHQRWGWLAASGILSVLAAVVAFVWPGVTAIAFVYLIAAWAIFTGVAEIAFVLAAPITLARPCLAGLSGFLSVVFGVLLAVWPRSGEVALTWLIGIYAIVNGLTILYYAVLAQGIRREAKSLGNLGQRLITHGAQG